MIDGEFVVDVDFVDRGYHLNNNTALLTSNSQRHTPQSKGGEGLVLTGIVSGISLSVYVALDARGC